MVQSILHEHVYLTYIIRAYLSGLIGNLRTSSPDIFKFYCYLKDRVPHVPLSPEEKGIASGEIELSSAKLAELVKAHGTHQVLLENAFSWQQEKAAVSSYVLKQLHSFHHRIQEPWSQERFEELLIRWIVTSDQPFNEVENPELVNLLKYVNWSLSSFKIPSRFTVKHHVASIGAEGVQQMKELFLVCVTY